MDDNKILVSIQCLVYNHEPYLRQCLDGFVMQKTNFRFEAIVHDDVSTDGSVAIIREYAEKYPDIIKPIYETENQYSKRDGSLFKIMNAACKGKYIAMCEGDDYWIDPLKLQKQVDILESDDSVSMVYTSFKTVDSKGNLMRRPDYENYKKRSFTGDVFYKLITSGNFIMTLTTCFRKEIYENDVIKGYPVMLDYALFLGVSSTGKAVFLPEETGCYRYVGNSATNANSKNIQRECLKIRTYYVNAIFDGKINREKCYSLNKRIKFYTLLLSNALKFYFKGLDKELLKLLMSKKKELIFLIPVGIFLILKEEIKNHI